MRTTTAGILTAVLFGACSNPPPPTLEIPPAIAQALSDLEAEQERIAAEVSLPMDLEFEDHGLLTVRYFALEGYPGNTWLRARFHYTNTTGRHLEYVLVGLEVLDHHDRLVAAQRSLLTMPWALPFAPETIFADELKTKTQGVHRMPGWKWRFTLHAEFEELGKEED